MNTHIQWAIDTLSHQGYVIQNTTPEIIQQTPWSDVCRFLTNQGYCYLKKTPPALSQESMIINILHEQFHAHVPRIIADNPEQHCFLMHDAGIPLRKFFTQGFQPDVLIQAVQHYTAIQLMTANKLTLFLEKGVPDWRLEKFPLLYQQLIEQEDLLIGDGLTSEEIKKLQKLSSKLLLLCEQLSYYNIPETLGHCDFHDNNILVNTQTHQITLIDLGEVAITHPFFSFLNCVQRAQENYALTNEQYQRLQEACFKHWLSLESPARLFEILSIMRQCWPIHSVLGEYRLMHSVDQAAFQALHREGRLAKNLRFWLKQA